MRNQIMPAAFGRLCVETRSLDEIAVSRSDPAAFGRLCVETNINNVLYKTPIASRLRAAVC